MNLTDKYSGLPLWGWGVIGGGVIGGTYLFVSRFRKAKTTNTVVQPPTDGGPLIIPLAGPPGVTGLKGDKGDTGSPGVVPATPPAPPPTKWTQPPSTPDTTSQPSYIIKSGDTLWKIARQFGFSNYMPIYEANKERIESAARSHGKSSSNGPEPGHWIYPGTMLQIPK